MSVSGKQRNKLSALLMDEIFVRNKEQEAKRAKMIIWVMTFISIKCVNQEK